MSLVNLRHRPPPWHADLPTHSELLRTPFGKSSTSYSFTQEACFETSLFTIFKSGYLDIVSFHNVCQTHPLVQHLASMIAPLSKIDFRSIREHDKDWASIQSFPKHANLLFLAVLFHYDCHLSAAVRYLGGKYLGGHRDVASIVQKLQPHVDQATIDVFQRVMTQGCPAHFNAETSRSNALDYLRHGNSSSVSKHQHLVEKALLKEYRNNYAVPLPHWVSRFLRHIFFTPIHILDKPGRAPRIVFDALKLHQPSSKSVNTMTSTHTGCEMDCAYGDVLLRLLTRIWNLRITYPAQDIVLHCNDVKSCFRQLKHHPDIVGAFCHTLLDSLWVPIGLTFGSDFSPASWEPVRRTIEQLARGLFADTSLRKKHRKYLDKLRWDRSLGSSKRKVFVPAKRDAKNPGVLDENGVPFPTPHDMFVDDDCYAEIYLIARVEQAIAASIEAIFIVLGDSDLLSRQDPISWDKLFEMVISFSNKILGLDINTRQLDVGPPAEFLQRTISKLQAFHSHRKAFTVSEMTELVGLLGYIASSCRWLRHLLSHLYTSITAALQVNQAHLISSSRKFREAIKAARANDTFTTDEPSSDVRSFAQSWVARTVHRAQKKHYLNITAKLELQIILAALQEPKVSKRCPIAHLVDRVEDCQAHGDSSLDAAGGFSLACRFWWYHEWSDEIRQLTLRFMRTNKNGRLISINALEFATVIINYAAITLYFRENEDPTNPFPTALIFADNTTAESWAIKGCKKSPLGRALGRLLCAILINNPVGLALDRVSTHDNVIADKISRLKSEKDSLKFFESLASSHPQLRTCRRFIPSPELISAISEALLQGNNADPLSLNKLLLQNPGRFTI